jgi:signal transduction histidine kinase
VELPGSRVVAVPVAADEEVIGAIRAEQSTATSDARSRRIVALLAGLAVLVVAVGAMIGWILAGRLARPVRRLRDTAVRLGDGDFSIEAPRSTVPELDELAQAMTATSQRLDDLVTRERAFSADVSHQLRTPLAGLRASIETEIEFPRPDATVVLHEAISDIDRLERTITELLTIARTPNTPSVAVSLGDVLAEVGATWRQPFARAGRSFIIANARYAPMIQGHTAMLRHALDVVLDNALHHGAGEVRVDYLVADETVIVAITDDGPGFSERLPSNSPSDPTLTQSSSHSLGLGLAGRLIDAMPGRLMITHRGPHPRIEIVLRRSVPTTS